MPHRREIKIRDPFVLTDHERQVYYLYGTTDLNPWEGAAEGFDVYRSEDLEQWEGPFPAFRPDNGFWADTQYWAPEVYAYGGQYVMFASFKAEGASRGTQVLAADHPLGPFRPFSERPVTPPDWECLDGTLYVDEAGIPWMVFCHEWLQVTDGTMCVIRLSADLKEAVEEPTVLFRASEAPWSVGGERNQYVTDGPFLYRNAANELLMLWSSGSAGGYAIGIARSTSGSVLGPWVQEPEPLFDRDGGHGMLFRTLQGELMLAIHSPNVQPLERAVFFPIEERNGTLTLRSTDR